MKYFLFLILEIIFNKKFLNIIHIHSNLSFQFKLSFAAVGKTVFYKCLFYYTRNSLLYKKYDKTFLFSKIIISDNSISLNNLVINDIINIFFIDVD